MRWGFRMFADRYIRTVICSRVLLHLGIWIRNYAVLLYVTDLTHEDPTYVSLISVAEFAPIFLFGLIGGTFADRWRPRRTMVWSDRLSALSVVAVLLAVMNGGWAALLVGSFVSASLSQFSQPSAMKLYKRHVPAERLQGAMAMSQTLVAVFTVLGPVVGTFIFLRCGIEVSLLLTAVLFVGSSLILSTLPRDAEEPKNADHGGFGRELTAGLRYIGANASLRSLGLTLGTIGLASGLTQPLHLFLVIEKLGQDKTFLQWFLMANGIAMLAGGAAVAGLARKAKPRLLLLSGLLATAVCTAGIGASTSIGLTFALLVASGLAYPAIHAGIQTLVVRSAEGAYIGRVSGTVMLVFSGTMVLGMLFAGYLKDAMPLTAIYAMSGGLIAVGALLQLPGVRKRARATEIGPAS